MTGSAGMRKGDELAGKVALVTGGARNIGRAISRALAAGGAAVMVNARTSEALARETVAMIEQAGGRAALHIADVTDPQAVSRMVDETLKLYGRLDILVNNAAVRVETAFEETTLEEWRRVLAIVLDGAFLCTQAALPHLKRSDAASVVNIGGLTGHKGALHRAHDRDVARAQEAAPGHHQLLVEHPHLLHVEAVVVAHRDQRVRHHHEPERDLVVFLMVEKATTPGVLERPALRVNDSAGLMLVGRNVPQLFDAKAINLRP